jgi:hypothetical protein
VGVGGRGGGALFLTAFTHYVIAVIAALAMIPVIMSTGKTKTIAPMAFAVVIRLVARGEQEQEQGAPKKRKKNDVPTCLPFLRFFEIFRFDFRKYFYGVFGLLMLRNGQKRDKKKSMGKDGRKKKSQLFRPKVFDMDFSQKVFYGVFKLPLMRNAQKRH